MLCNYSGKSIIASNFWYIEGPIEVFVACSEKNWNCPMEKKYNNRKMHLKNYVSICPIRHFGMILSICYELFVFFLTLCWMLVINKQGLSGFSTWDFKKHVNGFFAKHVEKIFANVNEILMNVQGVTQIRNYLLNQIILISFIKNR